MSIGSCHLSESGSEKFVDELPNFSLQKLQVISNFPYIYIYIPKREYEEKNYKELAEKNLSKKLAELLKEKTKDKLTEEDINMIIEGIGTDILNDIKIKIINDPIEYGEQAIEAEEDGKSSVKSVCGDIKTGKYEDICVDIGRNVGYAEYITQDTFYQRRIKTIPNFSIGAIQAIEENAYDTVHKFDGLVEKIRKGSTLKIYIPEKEYDEKNYIEFLHNKKREKLIQIIMQQPNSNMSVEEVRKIADELADKIELDKEVAIATSPYKYAEMMNKINKAISVSEFIKGDTTWVGNYQNDVEFTLNMAQIVKQQTSSGICDIIEKYNIYIPSENYMQDATYQYLLYLDKELEIARAFSKSDKEEEKNYARLMAERREVLGQDRGEE